MTVADSNGAFVLRHLPPDSYLVRGFVDANSNHTLDRIEIWDSTAVNLADRRRSSFWPSCTTRSARAYQRSR